MPSHELTEAERSDGVRTSKTNAKERVKIARMNARTEKMKAMAMREAAWFHLAGQVVSNPAVIGTALYLAVGWLEKTSQKSSTQTVTTTTESGPSIPSWLQGLVNIIPGGKQIEGDFSTITTDLTTIAADFGWDALKAALLAYIASGGNLAGVLTSGANILSSLPDILAAGAA